MGRTFNISGQKIRWRNMLHVLHPWNNMLMVIIILMFDQNQQIMERKKLQIAVKRAINKSRTGSHVLLMKGWGNHNWIIIFHPLISSLSFYTKPQSCYISYHDDQNHNPPEQFKFTFTPWILSIMIWCNHIMLYTKGWTTQIFLNDV